MDWLSVREERNLGMRRLRLDGLAPTGRCVGQAMVRMVRMVR